MNDACPLSFTLVDSTLCQESSGGKLVLTSLCECDICPIKLSEPHFAPNGSLMGQQIGTDQDELQRIVTDRDGS